MIINQQENFLKYTLVYQVWENTDPQNRVGIRVS